MSKIAPYAKAVVSGVAAAVGSLLLVVTGNETFADVTLAEWLIVVSTVLASFGFTYGVKNSDA